MTTAKTIIGWDGHDEGPVLRELHALPPGRYAITPIDEAWNLTDEEEADLEQALDETETTSLIKVRSRYSLNKQSMKKFCCSLL
jgi:hypothetical protein